MIDKTIKSIVRCKHDWGYDIVITMTDDTMYIFEPDGDDRYKVVDCRQINVIGFPDTNIYIRLEDIDL